MLKLRLARTGPKNYKKFLIVATNHENPRDSNYKEIVGVYNPNPDKKGSQHVELKADRVKYWIAQGAHMTQTVAELLGKSGLLPMPPERYTPIKDHKRQEYYRKLQDI